MTIGAGAAVVSMPGGAGVVTPNVTVMIVIFTLDVILCFLLSHCLAIIYHFIAAENVRAVVIFLIYLYGFECICINEPFSAKI